MAQRGVIISSKSGEPINPLGDFTIKIHLNHVVYQSMIQSLIVHRTEIKLFYN